MGSTIIETNNSKTVLARYEYDAFGAIRSQTGTSDNPRKFTGKEYDADVKLYYYSAPYIGRFTSRDPGAQGLNWYLYTDNNPLIRIDRDGRFWETIVDIFGLGLSFYDFVKAPGWGTGAIFVYDLGAVFVPFVPGTATGRIVAKVTSKITPSKAFTKVKKFKKGKHREYLQRLTHGRHGRGIMEGYHAHHIIPQKYRNKLKSIGSKINIDNPALLTWWEAKSHQHFDWQYCQNWDKFFSKHPKPTDDQILEYAHKMAEEYKEHFWKQQYYFELFQEAGSGSQLGN